MAVLLWASDAKGSGCSVVLAALGMIDKVAAGILWSAPVNADPLQDRHRSLSTGSEITCRRQTRCAVAGVLVM